MSVSTRYVKESRQSKTHNNNNTKTHRKRHNETDRQTDRMPMQSVFC